MRRLKLDDMIENTRKGREGLSEKVTLRGQLNFVKEQSFQDLDTSVLGRLHTGL